jgi:hypothetical protein
LRVIDLRCRECDDDECGRGGDYGALADHCFIFGVIAPFPLFAASP